MGWDNVDELIKRLNAPPDPDGLESKVALLDPKAQFGELVRARYGLTTRDLDRLAAIIFKRGAGERIGEKLRAYFARLGVVYNWSESFPTVSITAHMLTALHEGSRTDVRKVTRVNKGVTRDDNGDVIDPIGGPTTIEEYEAASVRIEVAAEAATRPEKPKRPEPGSAPVDDPDLVLWEEFLRSKASSATAFAESMGWATRTTQYRLSVARSRLIKKHPNLANVLPEGQAGRPTKMRKVAGVRGEGADPAPVALPASLPATSVEQDPDAA
jgi:hypothetical protein